MRKIGYARVSTSSQNLDRQIASLRAAKCEIIFREKASCKDTKGRRRTRGCRVGPRNAIDA
jgi:DNA invertase Pin-like site-specific DNA recombinase